MADIANQVEWLSTTKLMSLGLLKPNRFKVEITPPQAAVANGGLPDANTILAFHAFGAQVSNIQMDVKTANYNTWINHSFGDKTDQDLQISFLENAEMRIRKFFMEWIRLGFDPETKARGFPKDLEASEIKITPLDEQLKPQKIYDIFKYAVPFIINDLNYSMESENQYLRTDVTFKFKIHDIVSG